MAAIEKSVLITAGYGNQARIVIPLLRKAGFHIRAMRASNRPGPGPLDLGAHEVVVGDASNPDDISKALAGIRSVYHVGPTFHAHERQMGFTVIEAAKRAAVEHFVFSSVLHPILTGLPQHAIKRDIEERLNESGLNFTILQPSDYMQAVIRDDLIPQGVFTLPWDLNRRQALVDLQDVAEVVVKVLQEESEHYGATYELTSGDNFTAHEIADCLAKATRRNFSAQFYNLTDEMLAASFGVKDLTQVSYQASTLKSVIGWYHRFDFVGNRKMLKLLLGREPTSVLEYARRTYGKTVQR